MVLGFFIFYIGISIGSVFGIIGTLSGAQGSVGAAGMAMDFSSYLPAGASQLSSLAP